MSDRIIVMHDGRVAAELPAGSPRSRCSRLPRARTSRTTWPDPRTSRRQLTSTGIVDSVIVRILAVVRRRDPRRDPGRSFFSPGNIRDILTGMSVLGLVAIGQTLVILAAPRPLGVYVMSLASLIAATTMNGKRRTSRGPSCCSTPRLRSDRPGQRPHRDRAQGQRLHRDARRRADPRRARHELPGQRRCGAAGFQPIGATRIGPVPVSTIIMIALAGRLVPARCTRTRPATPLRGRRRSRDRAPLGRPNPRRSSSHTCSARCSPASPAPAPRPAGWASAAPPSAPRAATSLLSIAAVVLGGTLLSGGGARSGARSAVSRSSRSSTT